MVEFTFRSAGFFEREIDLSQRSQVPVGVPAGIIGTADKGPAFVPVIVGSFEDFKTRFGTLNPDRFAPYAVNEYLRNRNAVTFMRVLGAGGNDTDADIEVTRLTGQVRNAGYVVTGTTGALGADGHVGAVQFLCARHDLQTNELVGLPMFSDNASYGVGLTAGSDVHLIRGVIFTANNARIRVLDGTEAVTAATVGEAADDVATVATVNGESVFKLIISSSDSTYDADDGLGGIRILTASLNPGSANYIGKIMNTNPKRFGTEKHLLYLDFAVDDEVASVATAASSVVIASGSSATSQTSGNPSMTFLNAFGHFDTRYRTPRTPSVISQPFGQTEHDLFYFEALSDGEWANKQLKISIAQVRKSSDPSREYGTFAVQVRAWSDTDTNTEIIEQYPDCSLDPKAENYVAKVIGDRKVRFNFDAESEDERRLIVEGRFANKSTLIRIVLNSAIEKKLVPQAALPFGFRGIPTLKTNDTGTDDISGTEIARLAFKGVEGAAALSGAIVPPLPYRFKVTRGTRDGSAFAGSPGATEIVDGRFYWGARLERVSNMLNPNVVQEKSRLADAYSKLQGLGGLDVVTTGSLSDTQNANKFTLARVAFSNTAVSHLTGTVGQHILEAAYIRNGQPDSTQYKVSDGVITGRITLGTLVNLTSSVEFNRFTDFNKFTMPMYGGFDGTNILDDDAAKMNDKASSNDTGGGATTAYTPTGLAYNPAGTGRLNNSIASYRQAVRLMTDELVVNSNLLAIPGIRDSYITDLAAQRSRDFGMEMFIMDIPEYDDQNNRLFDDSSAKPDVRRTVDAFESRAIDNNYVATYFPDVKIDDEVNNKRVTIPASVAALAALGYNDRVAYPWYAPAGFNRGALEFVRSLDVRIDSADRDIMYEARINPIAKFPREGIAIFGQKTLQYKKSALDRVNVRRLMLELKRLVVGVARRLVFEQNTTATRAQFISQCTPLLGLIQAQAGIEGFKIVMDDSNNSIIDNENNKLNGRIHIIPTRAVEYIAMDFIITPSGVEFTSD